MNIIKSFHGQKIVMLLFYLNSILYFNSCQNEHDTPDSYDISIDNQYFESIDSVCIDSQKVYNDIPRNQTITILNVQYGKHIFQVYTHSALILTSDLILNGSNSNVRLVVNEKGAIYLK